MNVRHIDTEVKGWEMILGACITPEAKVLYLHILKNKIYGMCPGTVEDICVDVKVDLDCAKWGLSELYENGFIFEKEFIRLMGEDGVGNNEWQ